MFAHINSVIAIMNRIGWPYQNELLHVHIYILTHTAFSAPLSMMTSNYFIGTCLVKP